MKYAVVYESATGNTKMLADEIKIYWGMQSAYISELLRKISEHDEGGRYCFHWLLDG